MQPKRLLMISTDRKIFEEGSAVRARQVEYAKEWDEVHIIVFEGRSTKDGERMEQKNFRANETVIAPNCWAYSTGSWSKFMYPFDAIRLGRFIIEKRGITNITCQDASLTAMAGISLKKQFQNKSSAPVLLEIQVHEDLGSPNYAQSITRKIRKILALSYLPKADQIRVVSNRIKDYLVGSLGIDGAKITVKPIVVDVEKIKNAPILAGADLHKKYPQFEKIVLMAGRLEREKNVGLAIRAWMKVIKAVPKAGLVIIGSGSQKNNLEGQVRRLKIENSVIFEGWQNYPVSYYKTCDCFLVTSLFEGYGLTLAEVRAANIGVSNVIVSTDVGIAKEVGAKIVGYTPDEIAIGVLEKIS